MNREYVLARCIDEVRSGRSTIEDCVKQNPGFADLRPLLEMALRIEPGMAGLSAASRARIRSGLLSAMREQQESRQRNPKPSLRPVFSFRMAGALAAIVLAVAAAGGGTVYASQRSTPGDTLYAVKTGSENVQLALTFGSKGKADLRLKLAQRRVDEIASEAAHGEDAGTLSSNVALELDKAIGAMANLKGDQIKDFTRRLAESSLHGQLTLDALTGSSEPANKQSLQKALDVLRRGKLIADVSYENPSFLSTRPSVSDDSLEDGEFKISGTLTKVDGSTWQIDGLTLHNVHYSGSLPPVDGRVVTEGVTHAGQTFVVKAESDKDTSKEVSIQGTFKGTAEGGSVWNVGGIQVAVPKSISPPSEGDELHLRRPSTDSTDGFAQVETKQSEDSGVEYEGRLSAVDAHARTITVTKSGTHIKVNVSGALIRTEDDRELTLAQLQASVGSEVEIKGLYRKDGVLCAVRVEVEGVDGAEGND